MKGGAVLEVLGRITAIAFDKTGTLTAGKPVVTDIVPAARADHQILSLAGALESGSSHPLALAVLERAEADDVPISAAVDANAVAGEGVKGVVDGEQVFFGSPRAAAKWVTLAAEHLVWLQTQPPLAHRAPARRHPRRRTAGVRPRVMRVPLQKD